MIQPNLLELAKQGDAQAITSLMNRQLQPKGITVKVALKDACLEALANLKEATRLYLEECPLLDIGPDEMRCSDTNEDKLSCLMDSGNRRSSKLVG
ncbi:hypothetical protein [Nostoc sp.]